MKIGARGKTDQHYISGAEPLRYAIYFENKPDASAPAQTVVVTDQLDASKMDLSTFSLGLIGFGEQVINVPPGLKSYNTDVDLRPAKNLIVRIQAALDSSTGIVTWRFTSIDPATNQATTDPLAGFLLPNKTGTEGEGSVLFTVMPQANLPTGMEIRNTSKIVFDLNASLDTNEWRNTIDNSNPVSRVQSLAATQNSVIFNVSWSGTDTGSGVSNYTIYVSENGGPYQIWLANTTQTSADFIGQPQKTYSFFTVATDQANNQEAIKPTAEASTSTPTNITNAIDDARFFVHQHYLDFLGREPDPMGYQGWQNILNNCPPSGLDAAGNHCDRIEVSSDFFRSEEFQIRGYFIYRFYAAVGRVPHFMEFMPDFARVSGFLTAEQLEANKVAFVTDFMARQEFQTKYGLLTDPTAYVTALLQSVGLPNHPSKATWIDGLTKGTLMRAAVLRAVVESMELYQKYYNEGFVIMQYFGYLRRDADILYLDWIKTLDRTGDYRTMINGFMNSQEYRQRFGP